MKHLKRFLIGSIVLALIMVAMYVFISISKVFTLDVLIAVSFIVLVYLIGATTLATFRPEDKE